MGSEQPGPRPGSDAEPTAAPALDQLPTPALLVDESRSRANVEQMAAALGRSGVALRPHFKTSKSLEVASWQRAAGAAGLTCSTPAEVELLSGAGYRNLLWAHLPVGAAKVAFAVELAGRADLLVAVDSVAVAGPIAAAALAAGHPVGYLLEVDTGQGRAGVAPERAVAVVAEIARLGGLELRGVMTHEGHLAGFGDDRAGLLAAGRGVGERLAGVATSLREGGHPCGIVSVGSTPGATSAPFGAGVTEARPGTYVYYDANQVRLGSATLAQCALSVLASVVSAQPGRDVIIDAGLKAMSSDAVAPDRGVGMVCDLDVQRLQGIEFWTANEEHGFLRGPQTSGLTVGDRLRIVPNHACGTVNMWSGFQLLRGRRVLRRCAIEARH